MYDSATVVPGCCDVLVRMDAYERTFMLKYAYESGSWRKNRSLGNSIIQFNCFRGETIVKDLAQRPTTFVNVVKSFV